MGYLTEHHSQFGPLGWPEQWLRVRRWHERVAPILADPPRPRPPTEADAADDVFAFFMRLIVSMMATSAIWPRSPTSSSKRGSASSPDSPGLGNRP